jgi:hypothetical protein
VQTVSLNDVDEYILPRSLTYLSIYVTDYKQKSFLFPFCGHIKHIMNILPGSWSFAVTRSYHDRGSKKLCNVGQFLPDVKT